MFWIVLRCFGPSWDAQSNAVTLRCRLVEVYHRHPPSCVIGIIFHALVRSSPPSLVVSELPVLVAAVAGSPCVGSITHIKICGFGFVIPDGQRAVCCNHRDTWPDAARRSETWQQIRLDNHMPPHICCRELSPLHLRAAELISMGPAKPASLDLTVAALPPSQVSRRIRSFRMNCPI
jgi:hypothetical protein